MASERRYVRLYAGTVILGLEKHDSPELVAQGVHDTLVAAGYDIANTVFLTRTTKKQVDATLREAGVIR